MNTSPFPRCSSIEVLEARIAPAGLKYDADLSAKFISMTINGVENPSVVVPGQKGEIIVEITNNAGFGGDSSIKNSKTCLNIWLSPNKTANYQSYENKIVDGLVDIAVPNLPAGAKMTVKKTFTVPNFNPDAGVDTTGNATHQDYLTPGKYYILGEIDGGNEVDIFGGFRHTNNFAASNQFDYAFQFGTVNGKPDVELHFKGGTNAKTTYDFSLNGAGTGELKYLGDNDYDLEFTNTATDDFAQGKQAANIDPDDVIQFRNITADGPIEELVMPEGVVTKGDVTLDGIHLLTLGALTAEPGDFPTLTLGGVLGDDPTSIKFGAVTGYNSMAAPVGLESIKVATWDNSAAGGITAPFLSHLNSGGVFEPNITLSGRDAAGFAMQDAVITGTLQNSTWTMNDPTAKVGNITADSMDHWNLLANSSAGELTSKNSILTDLASAKIQAASFAKISARTTLGANILATDAVAATGIGIGPISAGTIDGAKINAPSGGITSLNTGAWINGGELGAEFLGPVTTTTGDFSARIDLTGADSKGVALTSVTVKGDLRNNAFTSVGAKGKIGVISAHNFDHWDLVADGPVAELKSETDILTDHDLDHIEADSFGKITAGGKLEANIKADGKDAKGLSIGSIAAQTVDQTAIDAAAGGITSINVGQWINGGSIMALFIGQITTTGAGGSDGDFTAGLNLSGVDAGGTALGGAKIKGGLHDCGWAMTGANGRVGVIAAGDMQVWTLGAAGDVKEIKSETTMLTDSTPGEIKAATFGKITVGTTLDATIEATGADAKGLGIGTLTADTVSHSSVVASGGGIGTAKMGEWNQGGELKAKFIGKLTTTGGFLQDGNFTANLTLTDKDSKGMSLGGASIKGKIRDGTWLINDTGTGNAGDIIADAVFHSTFTIGGRMSDFIVKKDFDVASPSPTSLSAESFDSIIIGGFFNGSLLVRASSLSSDDTAMKKLSITTLKDGAQITMGHGGIGKLSLGEWVGGGALTADWIGTLSTSGDFTPVVTLNAANSKGEGLDKATIDGVLRGDWFITKSVGDIVADEIGATWRLNGNTAMDVGNITSRGNFAGEAYAGSFGAIKALVTLSAKIVADDGSIAGSTIKSVDAKNAIGAPLKAPGGIDKITVGEWLGGGIDVGKLNALNVTGKNGTTGNLSNAAITLGAGSVTNLTVKGLVLGTNITADATARFAKIAVLGWSGGKIDGGTVGEFTTTGGVASTIENATFHFSAPGGASVQSLGKLTTLGSVAGDTFTIDGAVGTINAGSISSILNITGNVNGITAGTLAGAALGLGGTTVAITAGSMDGATINAGTHDIGTLQVLGVKGQSGPFFKNTNVTAHNINTLVLNDVDESNTGSAYGVTADAVKSYLRKKAGASVSSQSNLSAATIADVVGKYSLTIV